MEDGVGGDILQVAANLLDAIIAENSVLKPENFKFVSEAIIATARIGNDDALALNTRLGEALFSDSLRSVLLRNPRSVVMYAMASCFVVTPSSRTMAVIDLFARLHDAGATRALHHPAYRNLEMDYIAANARGDGFFHDPFVGIAESLPWLTRDHIYSLTHVHFYNSYFGARCISYPGNILPWLEILIARARHDGDLDVLLELLICYASTSGAQPAQLAFHDSLAAAALAILCGPDGQLPPPDMFRDHYHPLFVAAIYRATRGADFAPHRDVAIARRHEMIGRLLVDIRQTDLMAYLAGYADHVAEFGPEPGLEPALALQLALVAAAAEDRTQAFAPAR